MSARRGSGRRRPSDGRGGGGGDSRAPGRGCRGVASGMDVAVVRRECDTRDAGEQASAVHGTHVPSSLHAGTLNRSGTTSSSDAGPEPPRAPPTRERMPTPRARPPGARNRQAPVTLTPEDVGERPRRERRRNRWGYSSGVITLGRAIDFPRRPEGIGPPRGSDAAVVQRCRRRAVRHRGARNAGARPAVLTERGGPRVCGPRPGCALPEVGDLRATRERPHGMGHAVPQAAPLRLKAAGLAKVPPYVPWKPKETLPPAGICAL